MRLLSPLKALLLLAVSLMPMEVLGQTVLRVSIPEEIDHFEANRAESRAFRDIIDGNVYETLVRLNHLGAPIPGVATTRNMNFNKTEVIFDLRQGVKFHDGSAFDCEAVQRLIVRRPDERDRGFRTHSTPVLIRLKRATCVSRYQIRLDLSEPYIFAIEDFASHRMALFRVRDNGFERRYVGTGPFMLPQNPRRKRAFLSLKRNPDYWGIQPEIDKIEVTVEPDDNLAIQAVLEDARDLAIDLEDSEAINTLAELPEFRQHRNNLRLRYGLLEEKLVIEINHTRGLLGRKDFRCGIFYALDREGINNRVFYSKGRNLYSTQSVYHPRYQEQLEGLNEKDLSSSKILLSQFEIDARGLPLDLLIIDTLQNHQIAEQVAEMMRRVGVNIRIRAVNFDEYRALFYVKRDYDLVLVNHVDANDIAHYSAARGLYGLESSDFNSHLSLALQGRGGEVTARARLNSMLQYQYYTCQHAFLLQRPEFYLSRGKWKFPNLNRASSGINFQAIMPR